MFGIEETRKRIKELEIEERERERERENNERIRNRLEKIETGLKLLLQYLNVEIKFNYEGEKIGRTENGQWEIKNKKRKK